MILAVALALVAQADADRWVLVAQTNSGVTDHVDSQTLRVVGDRRTYWRRTDFPVPQANGAVSVLWNEEADCSRRTHTLLADIQRDRAGAVVESHNYPGLAPEAVEPNSLGERVVNFACSGNSN